jgi:glycosyltransferase involved in cell wall biosynthesis
LGGKGISRSIRAEVSIAVITATLNVSGHIEALIESLAGQSDTDFEWVIADGGSQDGSLSLIKEANVGRRVRITCEADSGIYEALNRAIQMSECSHYLVVGADDSLDSEAIANFRKVAEQTGADIVAARVRADGSASRRAGRWEWMHGQFAHVDSHAVGTLFRKSLHQSFGYYSSTLKLAADQEFILRCARSDIQFVRAPFVAGDFNTGGTSGQRISLALYENYLVLIRMGHGPLVQSALLLMRLVRHRKRIQQEALR